MEVFIKYDKPFKNITELCQLLSEEKKLVIDDPNFASDILMNIGYYELINSYKYIFYDDETDNYAFKYTIEDIYNFHLIDKDFQKAIFQAMLSVENVFKNHLSYHLSQKYGVEYTEYFNKLNFADTYVNKKTHANKFIDTLVLEIEKKKENPKSASRTLRYYMENHNHIPLWILLKDYKFFRSISIYSILKDVDKNAIADMLVPPTTKHKPGVLKNMLNFIRMYRNIIAHNNLFIGCNIKTNIDKKEFINMIPLSLRTSDYIHDSVFTLICSILILMNSNILRRNFAMRLYYEVMRFSEDDIEPSQTFKNYAKLINLPSNFHELLREYIIYLENVTDNANAIIVKATKSRKIYHLPGGMYYDKISNDNMIIFNSELEAIQAGYRKSSR